MMQGSDRASANQRSLRAERVDAHSCEYGHDKRNHRIVRRKVKRQIFDDEREVLNV